MMYELTSRDEGLLLVEHLDLDAQLRAIRDLLSRHRVADEELAATIEEVGNEAKAASGERSHDLTDLWVDHLHGSVYQDAAHSMAAIGMIAPLLESFLVSMFAAIRDLPASERLISPAGRRAAYASDPDFWNARRYWDRKGAARDDIASGAIQLANAIGLSAFLPADLAPTLTAIFTYRNRMFHNGLEWPPQVRSDYDDMIIERGWPAEWFERALKDDKPWIIYMSDALIRHSLATFEAMVEGIGEFIRASHRSGLHPYEV